MMFRSRGWFIAGALLLGPGVAAAQSFAVNSPSIPLAGQGNVVVTFTNAATPATGLNFDLTYQQATITRTGAGAITTSSPAVSCSNVGMNIVSCFGADFNGLPATVTITIPFVGVAVGTSSLTFTDFAPAGSTLIDGNGADPGQGTATVILGPSGPALSYNPTPTTAIVVPASISGTAVTSTIAVTQTGGDTGQSTTLACTAPTGYVANVTGSPFSPGGTGGSIGLGCAGTAAAGTLSCVETRSGTGGGAPITHTWPVSCASAPGFTSTPADGGTLNIVGIQSSNTTAAVAVSNPGTATLTISGCTVTGAGFTLGTPTASIASGGTGSIPVTCAVPATAGQSITGTLQCNTNAAAPADVINYNLSCLSQSASIPTLGFGGKALMVLLMLGFGLVGFQLYRRAA